MKTTYQITNSELFNSKLIDVDIERLTDTLDIELEFNDNSRKNFTGYFDPNDFEKEYGFVLINVIE